MKHYWERQLATYVTGQLHEELVRVKKALDNGGKVPFGSHIDIKLE